MREHLEIFAVLKGVEENSLKDVVSNMVDEVSLLFLSYYVTKTLHNISVYASENLFLSKSISGLKFAKT